MNIIYARMPGYDWVSTPSDELARGLESLGCKLTLIDNLNYIPPYDFDFVWSPYESVTMLGHMISKRLNIPHYAHIEWLPPWRIFKECKAEQYGFLKENPELQQIDQMIPYYKEIIEAFDKA
ncbi:MAG: hypothetical protein PHH82_04740, partial [Candidatus ainarchaeum sp.]|nr:hypothetical protein [Candidatus ainarchaeum sp.]